MKIEIIEQPIQFHLHGIGSVVQGEHCSQVGLRLMNEMWQVVKSAKIQTTGINHWVYLPDSMMFVGVELKNGEAANLPHQLSPLKLELPRYLKHVHSGPYQELPEKWKGLKNELLARGQTQCSPSVEIYDHHCEDASKLETTILIGLR